MINLDSDKTTIDVTTQLVISSSDNTSIYQIFNSNYSMLRYNFVTSNVFIDVLFSENTIKSKHQFNCAQAFLENLGILKYTQ